MYKAGRRNIFMGSHWDIFIIIIIIAIIIIIIIITITPSI